MLNVSRVAQLGFDAEMGAQEGRQEFGYQFLKGVFDRNKAARKVAVEAMLGAGPVTQFVQSDAVERFLLGEEHLRWYEHLVERGHIAGPVAAALDVGIGSFDKRLGRFVPLHLGCLLYT